ncbi:glycosyltransferase [Solidesulfovibrio sp.]|uniref:glycosyltransferase family 2 protein n=1 Tax=Solidesulfovibrio sp. TaxID=2910990 RepID=UPI002610ACAE|nr:glycosyltransferase [Solidesulfovibrio sp.]
MAVRCSIIIRCYNEARHLDRLLYGISQQTMRDFEVLAVDSGSTDGTLGILERHGVAIHCLAPQDFSFGRSCNIGAAAARGDALVFVSAHAYPVYRNWLECLLKPLADPDTVIAYGKQRGNARSSFSERRIFKAWYPDRDQADQTHPFCNNANSALRREAWQALRFDESLTGLEDLDFAKRAVERGGRIAYVAAAEIVHVHEERYATVRNRYRREAIAYRRIYPQTRLTAWDFCRLYVGNVASDCRSALAEGSLLRHVPEIMSFRLMQFWGAYRGMGQTEPVSDLLKRRFYYPAPPEEGRSRSVGAKREGCVAYPEHFNEKTAS